MSNLFTEEDQNILFEGVDVEDDNKKEFMVKLESVITSKSTKLKEDFEAEKDELLEGYKAELATDMESKIDSYLDYVVESWIEDNELALESGIKMDVMESFMTGIKDLYEANNVNLDEESSEIVSKAETKISGLQEDLDSSLDTIRELKESLEDFKRGIIVTKHADGLTESQKEKLDTLVEGVEFGSSDTFNDKVKIIRESYFTEEKDEDEKDDDEDEKDDKKKKKGNPFAKSKDEANESYINTLAEML